MVSLWKQEKGNTKAINISKLMFGIKKTGNFLCDYLCSFYEFQGRVH